MVEILIIGYIVFINLISFFAMLIDKLRAKHHHWRIPEATLLTLDLLGGGIEGIIAMDLLPHKSNHMLFSIGIPLIIFLEYGAVAVLWLVL